MNDNATDGQFVEAWRFGPAVFNVLGGVFLWLCDEDQRIVPQLISQPQALTQRTDEIKEKQMGTNSTVQCLNTLQLLIYNAGLRGGRFFLAVWELWWRNAPFFLDSLFCSSKHHVSFRHGKRAPPYFAWLNITHVTGGSYALYQVAWWN